MQKYQPEYTQKILRKICVNLEPDIFMFLYKTKYMHKTDQQHIKCGLLSLLCLQTEYWFITLNIQK